MTRHTTAAADLPLYEQLTRSASDDYATAADLESVLNGWLLSWSVDGPASPLDVVLSAAATGDACDARLIKRVAAAQAAAQATAATHVAIKTALPATQQQRRAAAAAAADAVLANLDRMLAAVTGEVRGLRPALTGISTADAAVQAGGEALDAWRQLQQLATRYDAIRHAQQKALASNIDPDPNQASALYSVAQVREHLDLDPYWLTRRRTLRNTLNRSDRPELRSAPAEQLKAWANETHQPLTGSCVEAHNWWPTTNREAWLLEVCTRATPWVPSTATTAEAYTLARRATVPPGPDGNIPIPHQMNTAVDSITAHRTLTTRRHDSEQSPQ